MIEGIPVIKIKIPRVTFKEADELENILQSLISAKKNKIILDFSDCHFAESIVIGILAKIVKKIREKKGDIFIVTPSGSIKILFAQTGIYKIFKNFWSVPEAIEAFKIL